MDTYYLEQIYRDFKLLGRPMTRAEWTEFGEVESELRRRGLVR